MKSKWTPLVNTHAVVKEFKTIFDGAKFKFLGVEDAEANFGFDEATQHYEEARDKVCEVMGVRALTRPLNAKETRSVVIEKAKLNISVLEGVLPPKVALIMQATLSSSQAGAPGGSDA